MPDSFYTHELWYRSAIDETDQEWTRAEDIGLDENENPNKPDQTHHLRARVEIDGQNVSFILGCKVTFHDECEYQFRPIAPI